MNPRPQFRLSSLFLTVFAVAVFIVLFMQLKQLVAQNDRPTWRKVSPFTDVETKEGKMIVVYDGQRYELVAVANLPLDEIMAAAERKFGKRDAEKRFIEDLAEVLDAAGASGAAPTVKLRLKDVATGDMVTIDDAAMSPENRRSIMRKRPRQPTSLAISTLNQAELMAAADEFVTVLKQRWAYLPLGDIRLDDVRKQLRNRIESGEINDANIRFEMNKIVARGLDGHASVAGGGPPRIREFLPFLIEPIGTEPGQRRFVAFRPDRSQLLNDDYPYLVEMDGHPIEYWVDLASVSHPQGSKQYVVRHALRELRQLLRWRVASGSLSLDDVAVKLADAKAATLEMQLPLAKNGPVYGIFPRPARADQTEAQLASRGIGYLRLVSMDDAAVETIHRVMTDASARKHRAVIVDVRGNGGGSRDALRALFSYLTDETERPRVVNAAVYRKFADFDDDHLAARFMYRRDDPIWTDAERDAIDRFASEFQTVWDPPELDYSQWHYMVLSRLDDRDYVRFNGPVVVLMDAKCFSATDIFLAGLKGWPKVNLVGQASGGGSARAQPAEIADGRIELRLGSMVSFQPDGRLFDGHGVDPDIEVVSTPEYFLRHGKDNLLQCALEHLDEVQGKAE